MNYPAISFNAGELTPQVDARSDLDKYKFGCRTLENFIPRVYGPAERRPGTKYIDTTVALSRLIPFVFSNSVAYMLLFEAAKIYAYYAGARVLDGVGARLSVTSPYTGAHLATLQYKQKNDVMWITHGSYMPRKLSRTSATAFALTALTLTYGPFKRRNDLANANGITMTPSVTTGNGTLTASSATFNSGHVGALFSVIQPRVNTVTSGSKSSGSTGVIGSAIVVEGAFSFTTHGTWTGTVKLQRSIDNSNWEDYRTWLANDDRNIQYTGVEDELGVYYRINVTACSSGTIYADLTVNSSTQEGICRVTAFTNTTLVSMTVVKDFASTNADVRWSEGSWSTSAGFPKCMTFFGDRAVYASSTDEPQTLWFSEVGNYDYFYAGTLADSSFQITLNSDQRNAIEWITSLESILVGTAAGEWRIWSNAFGEPIKPSPAPVATQQTSHGSKAIQALPIDDVTLFVDTVGRKVREMVLQGEKYTAKDLTALAEHISAGTSVGITQIAFQRNPDPILWAVRDDGMLLSMVYDREQKVVAWSRHPMSL